MDTIGAMQDAITAKIDRRGSSWQKFRDSVSSVAKHQVWNGVRFGCVKIMPFSAAC